MKARRLALLEVESVSSSPSEYSATRLLRSVQPCNLTKRSQFLYTMATLPRRQSGNKLPEYKDYVNFVSAYRNGKKEEDVTDGQPIVLTINTRINSPEPISHGRTCESYSEFLGKTKHKKFGPVKPPICSRETTNAPAKKTVKTEIFLEINNDSVDNGSCQTNNYSVGKAIRQFENHNGHKELKRTQSSSSVEAKKKLFEEKTTNKNQPVRVSSPFQQNTVQGIKSELNNVLNKPVNLEIPNKEVVNGNKKIFDQLNRENQALPDKITHVTPPPIFTKKNIDISFNSVDSDDCREITKVFWHENEWRMKKLKDLS
ncbi:hypothetical protein WA026_000515 [Henosepilachna vigintioctopunctata]|uniref:Uncharacterized protein n=1 Tax=Henosepilachna vigintioctopunctata TaxID=420089 RepID=A0AAW1UXU1_9CUCU